MTPRWTHIRSCLRVAALGLVVVSCARSQSRPTASPGSVGQPTAGAEPNQVPAPTPATVSSTAAADLNRKLLGHLTPPTEGADLPLGPGDLIEISVFDVPELSSLKLRIPVGGSVTLPLLGAIPAAGLTPPEFEREIRTRLKRDYMNDPQVSVFVTEQRSQRVSVIGAVRTGGVYALAGHLRLADALALAGGLTEEAGHTVYVSRKVPVEAAAVSQASGIATAEPNGKGSEHARGAESQDIVTAVDLDALVAGQAELNLPLQSGDVVNIPRAGSYYVGGEVQHPGSFFLKARTTLQQGIVAAGGMKDAADWDDVRLYRMGAEGQRQVLTFSQNDFEQGRASPEIRQADIVVVGRSGLKAFLYGVRDFFRFGLGATIPF